MTKLNSKQGMFQLLMPPLLVQTQQLLSLFVAICCYSLTSVGVADTEDVVNTAVVVTDASGFVPDFFNAIVVVAHKYFSC